MNVNLGRKGIAVASFTAAIGCAALGHQFLPQLNGTPGDGVWTDKALASIQPELKHRLYKEQPRFESIKTPLGGTEGAFAKKEVTFTISARSGQYKNKERIKVTCTQDKAFGPIKCGEAAFSEAFFADTPYKNLPPGLILG